MHKLYNEYEALTDSSFVCASVRKKLEVDFFLKIHVESLDAYHEFIRLKLSRIDNIGILQSSFVLKEIFNTTEYDI